MPKKCIIITGMHRSGTSLHAGLMKILGINLGITLGPKYGVNDKGFFEHKKIMRNNQHLLEHLGLDWKSLDKLPDQWIEKSTKYVNKAIELVNNSFGESEIFCIKDPRFCRLVPMWEQIFKSMDVEMKIIVSIRHPYAVASSLQKRDRISKKYGVKLWNLYNQEILDYNTNDIMFSDYDFILENTEYVVNKLSDFIGIETKYKDVKEKIDDFVSKSLRHNTAEEIKEDDIKLIYNNLRARCIK